MPFYEIAHGRRTIVVAAAQWSDVAAWCLSQGLAGATVEELSPQALVEEMPGLFTSPAFGLSEVGAWRPVQGRERVELSGSGPATRESGFARVREGW